MKELITPEMLREYAAMLRRCIDENQHIENKTVSLIHKLLSDLDQQNLEELGHQMHKYIEESDKMYMIMASCACEFEEQASCFEEAAPPLFDFISNIDIKTWWDQAYPIIEQIATVTEAITGVAAVTVAPLTFVKWIRNKLQEKKKNNEYIWIKLILNEDEWSTSALSQKIELSESEAKRILKGFGYMWDAKKKLYIATENTHKLRSIKINSKMLY